MTASYNYISLFNETNTETSNAQFTDTVTFNNTTSEYNNATINYNSSTIDFGTATLLNLVDDQTIEISSSLLQIKDEGVTTSKISDLNVTNSKINDMNSSKLTGNITDSEITITGDLIVDTNTLYVDSTNNYVGILDSTPSYPLDVTGDINSTTQYRINNDIVLNSTTLGTNIINSSLTSTGTLTSLNITGDLTVDTNTLYVDSINDRVGICTTPSYTFDIVKDDATFRLRNPIGNTSLYMESDTATGSVLVRQTDGDVFVGDINTGNDGNLFLCAGGVTHMTIMATGAVGVLKTPSYSLDVAGDINSTTQYRINNDIVLNSTTLGTNIINSSLTSTGTLTSLNITGDLTVDTTTLYVDSTNDRVGISTLSPSYTLDIIKETGATFRLGNTSGNTNFYITAGDADGRVIVRQTDGDIFIGDVDDNTGNLKIRAGGTTYIDVLRNGNVGISKYPPQHILDIGGDVNTTTEYLINDISVLNNTDLGTNIINSSLTSTGTLTSLNINGDLTVDTNTLYVDSINNYVGILDSTPSYPLDVTGDINNTTQYRINNDIVLNSTTLGTNIINSSLKNFGVLDDILYMGGNSISNAGTITTSGHLLMEHSGEILILLESTTDNAILQIDSGGSDINGESRIQFLHNGIGKCMIAYDPQLNGFGVMMGAGSSLIPDDFMILDNGDVGIGTYTPSYKLDVTSDINSTTQYRIGGNVVLNSTTLGTNIINSSLTSTGTLTSLNITGDLTVDTNTLYIDSTNNRVGILDSTPSYPLDVAGNINVTTHGAGYLISGRSVLNSTTLGTNIINSSLQYLGTIAQTLTIEVDGDSQLIVSNSSDTSQDATIEIRGNRHNSHSLNQSQLYFTNYDDDLSDINILGLITGTVTDYTTNIGDMVFHTSDDGTNENAQMWLKSNGKTRIGSLGSLYNENAIVEIRGDTSNSVCMSMQAQSTTNKIIVFGTANDEPSNEAGKIKYNAISSVQYSTTSDRRLKKDIVDYTDGINIIQNLRPRLFKWINGNCDDIGFIAQEVAECIPCWVNNDNELSTTDLYDENNNMITMGLDYGKFTPLIVSALKNIISRVETLESTI